MPTPCSIAERAAPDGTPVIAIAGEIDLFTVRELNQAVTRAVQTRAVRRVVVDLTETTFIDSSCLGVLIGAHRRLAKRKGGVVIAGSPPSIAKTFRITGLDGLFTLADTLEAALGKVARAVA